MEIVSQNPKIVKNFIKNSDILLGGTKTNLLIFQRCLCHFLILQKNVSPVTNTKKLKVTEYVDIHGLQHRTKF